MNPIQNKILDFCNSDESQMKAIRSDKKPLLVEAPAGYGKTRTLLLKSLYLISEEDQNNYKKTLIVTYTNNGVSRLKKDLSSYLEKLDLSHKEIRFFKNKIEIVNFHSLSKKILGKHGYLIHSNLNEIYQFNFIQANKFNEPILVKFEKYIKDRKEKEFQEEMNDVLPILIQNCNQKQLPYFGILLLLLKLFEDNKSIKNFYNNYYSHVFIDEFQDINFLVNKIVRCISGTKDSCYFFGDELQTIFEFNGSDPSLVGKYRQDFPENYLQLEQSHRVEKEFLRHLEIYLRTYYRTGKHDKKINLDVHVFNSDSEEAKFIMDKSKEYFSDGKSCAILVGNRTGRVINKLTGDIFFNGLFEDENDNHKYFTFNEEVLYWLEKFSKKYPLRNNMNFFIKYFKEHYTLKNYSYERDYLHLLNSFIENYLMKEVYYTERLNFFKDVLIKNDLIKFVDYVRDKIVLITVHKSKGLEWDSLFIANMNDKVLNYSSSDFGRTLADMRLFYVAITRSKGEVEFSFNKDDGKIPSSFFSLPFIVPVKIEV